MTIFQEFTWNSRLLFTLYLIVSESPSYPYVVMSNEPMAYFYLYTHSSKPRTKSFATNANELLSQAWKQWLLFLFSSLVFEVSWVLQGVVLICETLS